MKDFINIDSIERLKRLKYNLKKGALIAFLATGLSGTALSMNGCGGNDEGITTTISNEEEADVEKVYMQYLVKQGDTLTSIIEDIFEKYPETKKFYTLESMIEEITRMNPIPNRHQILYDEYLIIPYYLPKQHVIDLRGDEDIQEEQRESAAMLEDYEDYMVMPGDSYWKIACMYTEDNNEIVKLVREIQDLNNDVSLRDGMIITIPNVEKYKLLHGEYSGMRR